MATESVDDPNKMREMAEQFAKDFNIDRQKYSHLSVRKSHVTFRTDHNYNGSGGWSEGEPGISVPNWIIEGHAYYTRECARKVLEAKIEGMQELATELKRYDWQLEDSINSNDVVCGQIDFSVAELRAAIKEVGGGEK